jgi:hypothetical protein
MSVTVLGLPIATFKLIYVVVSLFAMFAGMMVVRDMRKMRPLGIWNPLFFISTIVTAAAGFLFPPMTFGPPMTICWVLLGLLALGLFTLYATQLNGVWRWIYALTIIGGLYLNVFMGITQAFERIPVLHRYAPTDREPPYVAAQFLVFLGFLIVGFIAARRFRATGP